MYVSIRHDRSSTIADDMNEYPSVNDANLNAFFDFNLERHGDTITSISNMATGSGASSASLTSVTGSPEVVRTWDVSTVGSETVLTFERTVITAQGGWRVPAGVSSARTLIVGGGGGGGYTTAGGGGGGGVEHSSSATLTPGSTMTVIVGQGGQGSTSPLRTVGTEDLPNLDLRLWVAVAAVPIGHPRVVTVLMPRLAHQHLPRMGSGGGASNGGTGGTGSTNGGSGGTNAGAGGGGAGANGSSISSNAGGNGGFGESSNITNSNTLVSTVQVEAAVDGPAQVRAVRALVTAEEATMQVTVQPIAAAAVVAEVTLTTGMAATAGPVSSSFALQAWTTTIGRSQHGSTLPQKIMA